MNLQLSDKEMKNVIECQPQAIERVLLKVKKALAKFNNQQNKNAMQE